MAQRRQSSRRVLLTAAALGLGVAIASGNGASSRDPHPASKLAVGSPQRAQVGHDATPFLPGGRWRLHDSKRPRPQVVTPGTESTRGQLARAPSDAVVLFDGKDLSRWLMHGTGKDKGNLVEPKWKVENGYMEAVPGTGSLSTKEKFGDCQIHIEWATPAQVRGSSQGRGNSGVMIMGRYEIQILDSYENVTYADGQAAAIYGQYPPLVNASRQPGEWQTYDIVFEAPRFNDGKLVKSAYVTVFHNGVAVHHRQQMLGSARYPQVAAYSPHAAEEPLVLQNHGNPVRFRNIWLRRLGRYDEP